MDPSYELDPYEQMPQRGGRRNNRGGRDGAHHDNGSRGRGGRRGGGGGRGGGHDWFLHDNREGEGQGGQEMLVVTAGGGGGGFENDWRDARQQTYSEYAEEVPARRSRGGGRSGRRVVTMDRELEADAQPPLPRAAGRAPGVRGAHDQMLAEMLPAYVADDLATAEPASSRSRRQVTLTPAFSSAIKGAEGSRSGGGGSQMGGGASSGRKAKPPAARAAGDEAGLVICIGSKGDRKVVNMEEESRQEPPVEQLRSQRGGANARGSRVARGGRGGGAADAAQSDGWMYMDPHNNVHGPFAAEEVLRWVKEGYFQTALPVSSDGGRSFVPLREVLGQLKKQAAAPYVAYPTAGHPSQLAKAPETRQEQVETQRQEQRRLADQRRKEANQMRADNNYNHNSNSNSNNSYGSAAGPPQGGGRNRGGGGGRGDRGGSAGRGGRRDAARDGFNGRKMSAQEEKAMQQRQMAEDQRVEAAKRRQAAEKAHAAEARREAKLQAEAARELFSTAPSWWYKDHSGTTQGVFTGGEMNAWFDGGFFAKSLLIAFAKEGGAAEHAPEDGAFTPLAELLARATANAEREKSAHKSRDERKPPSNAPEEEAQRETLDPTLNMEADDETLDPPEESHESSATPDISPDLALDPVTEDEPNDEAAADTVPEPLEQIEAKAEGDHSPVSDSQAVVVDPIPPPADSLDSAPSDPPTEPTEPSTLPSALQGSNSVEEAVVEPKTQEVEEEVAEPKTQEVAAGMADLNLGQDNAADRVNTAETTLQGSNSVEEAVAEPKTREVAAGMADLNLGQDSAADRVNTAETGQDMAEQELAEKKQAAVGAEQTGPESLCLAHKSEKDATSADPPPNNQLVMNEMYETMPPEPAVDAQ